MTILKLTINLTWKMFVYNRTAGPMGQEIWKSKDRVSRWTRVVLKIVLSLSKFPL